MSDVQLNDLLMLAKMKKEDPAKYRESIPKLKKIMEKEILKDIETEIKQTVKSKEESFNKKPTPSNDDSEGKQGYY